MPSTFAFLLRVLAALTTTLGLVIGLAVEPVVEVADVLLSKDALEDIIVTLLLLPTSFDFSLYCFDHSDLFVCASILRRRYFAF